MKGNKAMLKHTAGPWEVVPSNEGKVPGTQPPPAIRKAGTDDWVAYLGGGSIHFQNAEANAHLIAAAPEMLDALRSVLERDPEAFSHVRAALKQATGSVTGVVK